jgi:hypothetical protein
MADVKKLMAVVLTLGLVTIAGKMNANAQEFNPSTISEMSKQELKASVEDGNKHLTVMGQTSKGSLGAFDCDGFFIGVAGGVRGVDNMVRPHVGLCVSYENIPLFRRGYKQLPDGRIVRNYCNPLSLEIEAFYGKREYAEAYSQGLYDNYGLVVHPKIWLLSLFGVAEKVKYRFDVAITPGFGFTYRRYDELISPQGASEDVYVANDGFGFYGQPMVEVMWRFSKNLAMNIFARGGVSTMPGLKVNEIWTDLRAIGEIGIRIPLTPNHRVVRVL